MNVPHSIKAITFDVGGTLIEPWPSVGHVYVEVAERHGLKNLSPETVTRLFHAAWRACDDFDYTRAGWERLVKRTFRGLIADGDWIDFFPELYQRFAEPDVWRIYEDVRPALEAVAPAGVRLGVISNWDERLRPLLKRLRLHDCFEVVVISCEVGCPKPSPAIFERAAAALGLSPDSILHVGDSFEMDVAGALSAGFHAVHLQRGIEGAGAGEIRLLTELPGWIAGPIRPR